MGRSTPWVKLTKGRCVNSSRHRSWTNRWPSLSDRRHRTHTSWETCAQSRGHFCSSETSDSQTVQAAKVIPGVASERIAEQIVDIGVRAYLRSRRKICVLQQRTPGQSAKQTVKALLKGDLKLFMHGYGGSRTFCTKHQS